MTFNRRELWGLNGVFVRSSCLKISTSIRQHCLPLADREGNHKLLDKCLLWLKGNWDIQVFHNMVFPFFLFVPNTFPQSPYMKSLKLFFSNQHKTAERKIKGCSQQLANLKVAWEICTVGFYWFMCKIKQHFLCQGLAELAGKNPGLWQYQISKVKEAKTSHCLYGSFIRKTEVSLWSQNDSRTFIYHRIHCDWLQAPKVGFLLVSHITVFTKTKHINGQCMVVIFNV